MEGNIKMKFLLWIIFLLFFNIKAQDSCKTAFNQNLPCVTVDRCPSLMTILRGPKPISESKLDTLRSHHCGFDEETLRIPKVCCPPLYRIETSKAPDETTETIVEKTPPPPDVTSNPNLRLLNQDICGPLTEPKIFGGNETGVLDFPWMALIAYDIKGVKEFRCSGTIINKRYILTAAHCVTSLSPDVILSGVRVGEHDYTTERDCDLDEDGLEIVCAEKYQDFGIESFQFHDNYTKSKLHNDIALIRVDADIDFNPINVKPICLPIGTAATLRARKLTVTGWGATELNSINSNKLLMVNLSPVSNEECAKVYKRSKPIWYKQLCAGGESGKDSCGGDSGGPLQAPAMYNHNPRFVQYGIVSYGTRYCGTRGYPGVYTRVSYFVDWILSHITD
ncbi:hypothetical protein PV327_000178 [Microctonus hyperodae]|uniref:CLIP domain-containing serine protease n=1 Tax=Microctonus hyperodae TaxID=165561 RepID=A0AA39L1P8_MICHY|nr:hypothetical protein PV327_000178 [Microctonus hyperodae]